VGWIQFFSTGPTRKRAATVCYRECKKSWINLNYNFIIMYIQCKVVENKRPTWCHLLFLFHFLFAHRVSDINISIIRSLRLFCWIATMVVCSWFDVCWCFGVVGLEWYTCCRFQPATRLPLQPNTNTHRTKNTRPMWQFNRIVVSSWWWIY